MKIERINEYVTITIVTLLGLVFAIACGRMTGEGQLWLTGSIAAVVCSVTLCVTLRARVWLLIPLCWELTGSIPLLPIPFSVRDIAVLLVFGSFLVFYALKLLREKVPLDLLDLVVVANIGYLATVYIRNPVGFRAFGSELVGGRPYFNVAIACLAYWIMKRTPNIPRDIRRLPILLLVGAMVMSIVGITTLLAPKAAAVLANVYSAFEPDLLIAEEATGRRPTLTIAGNAGMRVLCSYFIPLTMIMPIFPIRFMGTIGSLALIALSGFRSSLFTAMAYMAMSTFFRKRIQDLFIFGMAGCLLLVILSAGNGRLFTLPLSVQRSLSFLPGNWDYRAVQDAKGSSEWRFEMWQMVLTEDKWIKNKWLGDGFGFTQHDLAIMERAAAGGAGFLTGTRQESFLIVGAYHSGPLSAIRYAGVVGLILLYILMVQTAVRGWRLIGQSRTTHYFPIALFVGMPAIFAPFAFTVIAGGYDVNLPDALFTAGLLRVLERAIAGSIATASNQSDSRPQLVGFQNPVHRYQGAHAKI